MRKLHTIALFIAVTIALQGCHHSTDNDSQAKPLPCTSPVREISEDSTPRTQANPSSLADVRRPAVKVRAKKGCALLMETEGLRLATTDSAVLHAGVYSVTLLAAGETAPLPQGMVNMTASAEAYRLLPGGDHFRPGAELRVTYDPGRLPEGYTPDDIYTSYYDTASLAWVRLERVAVDTATREIVSLTTHFTDFINELVKAPEMPETQAFVPTAMTDLEAVSPLDGLTLVQPPTANNNGTANLSYPFIIPPGRGGMQPNLALTYSSTGGSGWLGVGWDIPVPSITLDTRWGVPRYNASKETEIYLLDGEQLIAYDSTGNPLPLPHRTNQQTPRASLGDHVLFKARFGDAHDSIVRHGNSPTNYWWEVTDRHGVTHFYGHYPDSSRQALPVTLCDDRGNIARWPLCESRDLYGNTVRYYYDHATVRNYGAVGRQLYLDSISYTGHKENDGYYTVVFCRIPNTTSDIPVVCNNGFKEVTEQALNNVYLKCGDSIQTIWHFETENGMSSNYKNRLTSVTKIDSIGNMHMRRFLDTLCHCIQQDEDDENSILFTLDSHMVLLIDTVYDTIYSTEYVTRYDTITDSMGFIIAIDTIIDTQYRPKDWISHQDSVWVFVYDTIYPESTSLDVINPPYAGTVTRFSYYNAPDPGDMFGPEIVCGNLPYDDLHGFLLSDPFGWTPISQATGLGLSHSSSWNVGGTAAAGLGAVICLTSASLGGNYTRNQSSSESLMTLVDIDGDGLADKVFVYDGRLYYRKHIHRGDSISFGDMIEVEGISHFLQESSYSNTFGGQLAVGFSGSASWTKSKSTTSTYFADVNGDGLVDLVEDGQVWFNSLKNGNPTFVLYEAPSLAEGEPDTARVFTSASTCGGIIFDGEVNDSITCKRIWVNDTSFVCYSDSVDSYLQPYLLNVDTLFIVDSVGLEENMVQIKRYHREWDCSYHDDSPSTEAVRVWIAPREGIIKLVSKVGLKEDTSATRRSSKHADGIVYTFQHTS